MAEKGGVIWLTGIPASGKSTIARELEAVLRDRKSSVEILDGDALRGTLCRDLGFSRSDRDENVLRVAHVARLLARNGVWTIVSLVSPYAETRRRASEFVRMDGTFFLEVHVQCSRESAEKRDPKGLYARAKRGELWDLTGFSDPYEPPSAPGLAVDTDVQSVEQCVDGILDRILRPPPPPLILLGRGSSGTRLISRMAQTLGFFVGNELNASDDALEFVPLIYRLSKDLAARAELPLGSDYRHEIQETAHAILKRARIPPRALWGWKLPETMFILPLMLDAFPGAKVVHLVRDPIASSIGRRTHITADVNHEVGCAVLPAAYTHCGRDVSLIASDEQWMRNALSWEHQVGRIVRWCRKNIPPPEYMELRFEDVVQNPDHAAALVARFLGKSRTRWAPDMDHSKISRKPIDQCALEVWKVCGETGALLGYPAPELPPPSPSQPELPVVQDRPPKEVGSNNA